MLTNPRADRVKSVRALSRRSVRLKTGRFVADGPQSVREAVRFAPGSITDLYVTDEAAARHRDIIAAAEQAAVFVHPASPEVLLAMSETDAPQGMLAVCRAAEPTLAEVLDANPRLLILLTNVRDPGNAGTVIRAADAAGADAVLFTENSVDALSPKVVRSAAGSTFHLPVVTGLEVDPTLEQLTAHGIQTLAADGAGTQTLGDLVLGEAHAWVMGNEAWGLEDAVLERCDKVVRVPIHGKAESLNLAMAATICLYASAGIIGR